MSVYLQQPRLHEGAKELLWNLKEKKARMGLVTHAEQQWTDFKVDSVGIRDYFEKVINVDVGTHKHKGAVAWRDAIKEFGVLPDQVTVVGDGITGDIIASYEVGVKKLFWVNLGEGWSIFKTGKLPPGTVEIKSFKDVTADQLL
jgi:FMN phosphatase YigB (HAD superfamily)